VRDGNQPVCGLAWLAGPSASHQSGEESLLLALHPPSQCCGCGTLNCPDFSMSHQASQSCCFHRLGTGGAQSDAARLPTVPLLEQACGQVSDNSGEQVDGKGDGQGVEELAEEQARLIGCLREAVIMEAARYLDEIGQRKAALECCETLGEKGKELKIELLAAIPTTTPVQ